MLFYCVSVFLSFSSFFRFLVKYFQLCICIVTILLPFVVNKAYQTIVRDFQPFSIVEDEGFSEFVHVLDPSYVTPTRHQLSKELLASKYQQAVDSVRHVLSTAEAVSLTTDSWTSICRELHCRHGTLRHSRLPPWCQLGSRVRWRTARLESGG